MNENTFLFTNMKNRTSQNVKSQKELCKYTNEQIQADEQVQPRKAQYTPPTPTQLSCRVELRRRCVLNSQLVGDSLDESRL